MRKLLWAAALLVLPGQALACPINEARFLIATADAASTIYGVERRGYEEANPVARKIIGKRPGPAEVIAYRFGFAALQQVIACKLPERQRVRFDLITNIGSGLAVSWNIKVLL